MQGRIEAGTLSVSPEPCGGGRSGGAGEEHIPGRRAAGTASPLDLPSGLPLVMADAPAHRAGAQQPVRQRGPARARVLAHPGRGGARGVPMSRLPYPTRETGWRRSGCRICSASTWRRRRRRHRRRGTAWGWRSARGWWRRMAAASGPRAPGAGLGTTVTFTLPAAGEADPLAAAPPAAPPAVRRGRASRSASWRSTTTRMMLRLVRNALSAAGYAPLVTGEPSGACGHRPRREAAAGAARPDALPGSGRHRADGADVPELSDLPVIFISGYGRDETIARALDAGAQPTTSSSRSRRPSWWRAIRAALRRHEEPELFVLGRARRSTITGGA